MSEIQRAFAEAASENRAAFIPYLTAGFPDPDTFLTLLSTLRENGADVIEVGLPFSDPTADGPVIQQASTMALSAGITPGSTLNLIARAKKTVDCPIVLMTYYNPVQNYGLARFAVDARTADASGVLIPDLPLEEAAPWEIAAAEAGLDTVFMAARTTSRERLTKIVGHTRGFLYYVSLLGVTGSDFTLTDELSTEISRVKEDSPVPVAVGFGVSRPEQAAALARLADGVIVGSAIIRTILVAEFAAAMSRAMKNGREGGA
jgi:tryptophan synthase alpha chain